jgi:hypothetical protein
MGALDGALVDLDFYKAFAKTPGWALPTVPIYSTFVAG